MDGSSSSLGLGVGLILTSPGGDIAEYALCFEFLATNNKVKYEALIAGHKIAKEVGVRHLTIFSDFQLVVGQVKGKHEAREENIKRYFGKVKDLISLFQRFDIQQVPKAKDVKANVLSKLVASLSSDLWKGIYFEVPRSQASRSPNLSNRLMKSQAGLALSSNISGKASYHWIKNRLKR